MKRTYFVRTPAAIHSRRMRGALCVDGVGGTARGPRGFALDGYCLCAGPAARGKGKSWDGGNSSGLFYFLASCAIRLDHEPTNDRVCPVSRTSFTCIRWPVEERRLVNANQRPIWFFLCVGAYAGSALRFAYGPTTCSVVFKRRRKVLTVPIEHQGPPSHLEL